MKANFTFEQLRDKVIEIGKQNPEYVYSRPVGSEQCSYVDSRDIKDKGCIFGCAILALEPTQIGFLSNCSTGRGVCIREVITQLGLVETNNRLTEVFRLQRVQELQDNGTSWGKAIEVLLEEI